LTLLVPADPENPATVEAFSAALMDVCAKNRPEEVSITDLLPQPKRRRRTA